MTVAAEVTLASHPSTSFTILYEAPTDLLGGREGDFAFPKNVIIILKLLKLIALWTFRGYLTICPLVIATRF